MLACNLTTTWNVVTGMCWFGDEYSKVGIVDIAHTGFPLYLLECCPLVIRAVLQCRQAVQSWGRVVSPTLAGLF